MFNSVDTDWHPRVDLGGGGLRGGRGTGEVNVERGVSVEVNGRLKALGQGLGFVQRGTNGVSG